MPVGNEHSVVASTLRANVTDASHWGNRTFGAVDLSARHLHISRVNV